MKSLMIVLASVGLMLGISTAMAADIPYKAKVSLKVGQSVVLKGVRGMKCGGAAPSWGQISSGIPKSKVGKFSGGGKGTVSSKSCGGSTPALALRFTATAKGQESFTVYGDRFTVTVN